MTRAEFSKAVKLAAWNRSGGRCEKCGAKLRTGGIEYDHEIPCALGGEAALDNCIVSCRTCHSTKTAKHDIPMIASSNRKRNRHLGIAARRRPSFATNRDGPLKKKLDGTVVRRS